MLTIMYTAMGISAYHLRNAVMKAVDVVRKMTWGKKKASAFREYHTPGSMWLSSLSMLPLYVLKQ